MILIDEWVAYARSLVGRDDLAGGTFDDQFTFAQSLTEAVKGTPGVLLAISIPASESGDDAQPRRRQRRGGRRRARPRGAQAAAERRPPRRRPVAAGVAERGVPHRPPAAVHRRPTPTRWRRSARPRAAFVEMYRQHADEFPREARDGGYEDRIKQTYPIHPELFDRLYEDWSSLERFQRTRGVLRLMNTVIHALWVGEDQSPLIMPASIPIGDRRGELGADAVPAGLVEGGHRRRRRRPERRAGRRSTPSKPLFGQRSLTRRLARTVFFGAAPTIGSAHKGLETQRVFLGTAIPGDVPGNFHSALAAARRPGDLLLQRRRAGTGTTCRPTSPGAPRTRPSACTPRRSTPRSPSASTVRRRPAATFAGVHVCPEDAADIPDIDEARLVILHPKLTHKRGASDSDAIAFAKSATEHRGAANRTHRNMLVYLAGDDDRIEELDRSVRDYLGWSEILAKEDDLDLTTSQRNQATERQDEGRRDNRRAAARRLPVGAGPDRAADRDPGDEGRRPGDLAGRARQPPARQRRRAHRPARRAGDPPPARHDRRQAVGGRARDRRRALAAVRRVPVHAAAARPRRARRRASPGRSCSGNRRASRSPTATTRRRGKYRGAGAADRRRDRRRDRRDADRAARAREGAAGSRGCRPTRPRRARAAVRSLGPSPGADRHAGRRGKTRFFGSKRLQADRYASDFKKLADEVLGPLGATPGVTLNVTIEIEATAPDGFDDAKVRTVSENATVPEIRDSRVRRVDVPTEPSERVGGDIVPAAGPTGRRPDHSSRDGRAIALSR